MFGNQGTAGALTFEGGADDDIFVNVGTTTGQVLFIGDTGADIFVNEGSAQNLTFNGGADNDVFDNSGNTVNVLEFDGDVGSDSFRNTGSATTITFTGGADNDLFVNSGNATGTLEFIGDTGIDQFNNSGSAQTLEFSGGADNDIFVNSGSIGGMIEFDGDTGSDAFNNLGNASDIVFMGGADDDLFVNSGSVTNVIDFDGDTGADSLENNGSEIGTIDFGGDSGADILINNGSAVGSLIFDGGADNDTFVNYGDNVGSIDFTGDDGVVANAGPNSVDTLIVRGSGDGSGTVMFDGGAGADAFQNNAAGFTQYEFFGGADNDVFQNNAAGINNIDFTGDTGADVFENNGANVTDIDFNGDSGADILVNDGDNVTDILFTGGADNDLFLNTGSGVSVIEFDGDTGSDTFANSGSGVGGILFRGDEGADSLVNRGEGVDGLTFEGGADNDEFINTESAVGASNLSFVGDTGADQFINDAANANGLTFSGGADDDAFQNNGMGVSGISFNGDQGADVLINAGGSVMGLDFGGGADNDTFVNRSDGVSGINFGGDSSLSYNTAGDLVFTPTSDGGIDTLLNEGNDVIDLVFEGGADNDVFINNGDNVTGINFTGDEGADTLVNAGQNAVDIVFSGGADDDLLQNTGVGVMTIEFDGDEGADALVNSGGNVGVIDFTGDGGADILINKGQDVGQILFSGGADGDSLRSLGSGFDNINFDGDTGSDSLVQSGVGNVGSTVVFTGGADDDLFAWQGNAGLTTVDTGLGDDYLLVDGSGQLNLGGGLGDDYFVIQGNPNADVTIIEAANADTDTINFSAFDGSALNLDLRSTGLQVQSSEFSITLSDGLGIENVMGTSGADTILGNARDNVISGAEFAETSSNPLAGQRAETQWVLLDFDVHTNEVGELGEHVYSQDERDEIQRLMELTYWGPDPASADPANPDPNAASPWFNVMFTQDPAAVSAAGVTIFFNETPEFGRPGGEASEIDLGNINLGGSAVVQVNGLLGGEFTSEDGEYEEGLVDVGLLKPAATSENFVFLSTKIAAHELAHLIGLRHQDSFGPIGTGVHSPPGVESFKPAYNGPSGGFETFDHLLTSGASVGTDRFNDLRGLFFGERESVKLANAMSDQSAVNSTEGVGVHDSIGTATAISFVTLAVPNTLQGGLNSEKEFFVDAASIIGSIQLNSGSSENDFYSFVGTAGELINISVSSQALRDNGSSTDGYIDSIIRVYDSNGTLVAYYGGDAVNDDEFESSDSTIIDLLIPANDTYYVEIDTFNRLPGDIGYPEAVQLRTDLELKETNGTITPGEQLFLERLQDSLDDTDIGNYQMFIYKFGQANPSDDVDNLKGFGGNDTLIGGPGDNYDLEFPAVSADVGVEGTLFTRQITFTDRGATTWTGSVDYGDGTGSFPLTITDTGSGPTFDLNHTFANDGSFAMTVTVSNDIGTTASQTFDIVVVNEAPVAGLTVNSATFEVGSQIDLTGTATDVGADDTLTFSYEVFVDGSGVASHTGSGVDLFNFSFTPTVAGSYEIVLTVNDGTEAASTSQTVTVINPLAAENDTAAVKEETATNIDVLANDTFVSLASISISIVNDPSNGVAVVNSDGTIGYTPFLDFVGNDTLTYQIDDGNGNVEMASVDITITNLVDFSGRIFNDFDNDGIFEAVDGEYGLAGVTIEVWTNDLSTLVATTTTAADGTYLINANADLGDYKIIEAVDEAADLGLLDGIETVGSLGGSADNSSDSNVIAVSLTDTTDDGTGYEFAEVEPSDLFGVVWDDTNDDGLIDMGELGIGNVEITLTGLDDRGNSVTSIVLTQPDGAYALANLRPGTYSITETQPAGFTDGTEVLGEVADRVGNIGTPGFVDGNDKFSGIVLTPGAEGDLYNFGEVAESGTDIGDNVTATIGFWRSHWGRSLIKSLNGGQNSTDLGNWMATNFPNLYGPGAVYDARRGRDISMDMTGRTNKQVTKVFKYLYRRNHRTAAAGGPARIDAQLMAVVFATYVTSSNLSGGNYASWYGFNVTAEGIGGSLVDVSYALSAQQIADLDIQVDSNGKASIMEILTSADDMSTLGLLFDADGSGDIDCSERRLRFLGNWLYWFINISSRIGGC